MSKRVSLPRFSLLLAWASVTVLPLLGATEARGDVPRLDPQTRLELREAAQAPNLQPWQSQVMNWLAAGGVTSVGAATSQGPDAALQTETAAIQWNELEPHARTASSAAYDPTRNRMLVFGGVYSFNGGPATTYNDVWALNLNAGFGWEQLVTTGAPPSPRSSCSAIYDSVHDRLVIFGGYDGSTTLNDVWALSLGGAAPTWAQMQPSGPLPSARSDTPAIYDASRDRMVIFSGAGASDVWALSFAGTPAWSQLSPTGTAPAARYGHSAIYDPTRDRMVIYGGSNYQSDAWALSFSAIPSWSQLASNVGLGSGYLVAIYDAPRDRMVVFAGLTGPNTQTNGVSALTFATNTWSVLSVGGLPPTKRSNHVGVFDSGRNQLVTFGGNEIVSFNGPYRHHSDTYALSLASPMVWTPMTPSRRTDQTMIWDEPRQRVLVFGGYDGTGFNNDVYALALTSHPTWTKLNPTGTPPGARASAAAILDRNRDRMIVFGGYGSSSLFNDTWALTLAGTPAWQPLTPAGQPPPTQYQQECHAVYDKARDRMIEIQCGVGPEYQIWALTLASPTWSRIIPSGSGIISRGGTAEIYDIPHDRLIITGGYDEFGYYWPDVWSIPLANPAWVQLTPSPPLAHIAYHIAAYDSLRDRVLVWGGRTTNTIYNSYIWSMNLSGAPNWSIVTASLGPPYKRTNLVAAFDRARDSLIVMGGTDGTFLLEDVWALSFPDVTPPSAVTNLSGSLNCTTGELTLSWTAPGDDGATGTAKSYDFRFYNRAITESNFSSAWPLGPPDPAVAGTPQTMIDTDLAACSRWWYALKTRDEAANLSALSNVFALNTATCWPCRFAPGQSGTPALALMSPHPNPLRGLARLEFSVSNERAGQGYQLSVLDVSGRQVRIVDQGVAQPGFRAVDWDLRSSNGRPLSGGVYFLRLKVGDWVQTRTIVTLP